MVSLWIRASVVCHHKLLVILYCRRHYVIAMALETWSHGIDVLKTAICGCYVTGDWTPCDWCTKGHTWLLCYRWLDAMRLLYCRRPYVVATLPVTWRHAFAVLLTAICDSYGIGDLTPWDCCIDVRAMLVSWGICHEKMSSCGSFVQISDKIRIY